MENIAPPLQLVLVVIFSLQNGQSVKMALQAYLQETSDEFSLVVRRFLFAWEQGQDWRAVALSLQSPYRRTLIEMLAAGLSGQPILNAIQELKEEIQGACEMEMRRHLDLLPIRMLIPLLLFQFPAFLCLLFGPLIQKLVQEMGA